MLKINELLFSKSKSKKSVMCVTTAILEVELILHCLSYSIHHQQMKHESVCLCRWCAARISLRTNHELYILAGAFKIRAKPDFPKINLTLLRNE